MWLDVTYKGDAVSTNFLCEQKSARDLWTTKQHFCFCIYMHSQVSAIHKKIKKHVLRMHSRSLSDCKSEIGEQ